MGTKVEEVVDIDTLSDHPPQRSDDIGPPPTRDDKVRPKSPLRPGVYVGHGYSKNRAELSGGAKLPMGIPVGVTASSAPPPHTPGEFLTHPRGPDKPKTNTNFSKRLLMLGRLPKTSGAEAEEDENDMVVKGRHDYIAWKKKVVE